MRHCSYSCWLNVNYTIIIILVPQLLPMCAMLLHCLCMQLSGESHQVGHYTLLQQDLETKARELLNANSQIYELRRNVRELTDRYTSLINRLPSNRIVCGGTNE